MNKPKIVSEGILYRNPDPGHRVICAYLPNLVPLSDNDLLCFYRIGQAFYSTDGKLAKLRSLDGGKTWIDEGLVWDYAHGRPAFAYTAPHGALLRDGSLLLIAQRYPACETHLPRFNPKTGGMRPIEAVLFRSTDRGYTWSEPERLNLPGEGLVDTPSSIIELNDGRWFLGCEQWKSWDDPSPLHIKGFALFSSDLGRTWGDRIDFPSAFDPGKMYSHSRYTRMLDGRICALQWTQSIGGQENYDLHFVVSDQAGTKWTQPWPTGIPAQTSWVADLGNGRLAVAYTAREGLRPGIVVALGEEGGTTWDLVNQIIVWDAVGQEFVGETHKPNYPSSHDNIAFGKPNMVRLSGGEIMASWWCTQACVTHIRYARLAPV